MRQKETKTVSMVIGIDSIVRGTLESKGTVRIDGLVEGGIQADWVIIGESGMVQGDIVSRGAVLGGNIEGNIHASETAEITAKGQVIGDIFAGRLSIVEGGLFEGRSHMVRTQEGATVLPLATSDK
jgi:cytoskeletal protein CcmA (bactofilin family)